MGTRNLICVVKDGEYKVAKYCQWDGYPSGQGVRILKFLSDEFDRSVFEEKLNMVVPATDQDYENIYKELNIQVNDGFMPYEDSIRMEKEYPHLHRDMGADILPYIQSSTKELRLKNSLNFAADSLFCEWCYVIDLDKNTFEIFSGFNKEPLSESERFTCVNDQIEDDRQAGTYYPVKLVKFYELHSLPSESEFLSDLENDDEEEVQEGQ